LVTEAALNAETAIGLFSAICLAFNSLGGKGVHDKNKHSRKNIGSKGLRIASQPVSNCARRQLSLAWLCCYFTLFISNNLAEAVS